MVALRFLICPFYFIGSNLFPQRRKMNVHSPTVLLSHQNLSYLALFRSLSWKLHPPTAYCFCKHILFLLPQTCVPLETRYEILELARFLTELCVIDYYFVIHKASDVALAALLNSMETIAGADAALSEFEQELQRVAGGLNPLNPQVQECRARLHVLYTQGGYSRPEILGNAEPRDDAISPVCVAQFDGVPRHSQQQPAQPQHDVHPTIRPSDPVVADENFDANHQQPQYKLLADGVHDLTKNASPVSHQQQHDYDNYAEPQMQEGRLFEMFAETDAE